MAFHEGGLKTREHQMETLGLKLDRFTGLDLEAARNSAHLHHAAVLKRLMDLAGRDAGQRAPRQAIRRRTRVLDDHIAGSGSRAFRRRTRPGMVDFQCAELIVFGKRRRRE